MNQHARNIAGNAAVAALLMIAYGWGIGLSGASKSAFYNLTVDGLNWTLRIGGPALLLVAGICFAGLRIGLLLDFLVEGLCGGIMIACGAFWLARWLGSIGQVGFDLQDPIVLIFGFMFARAALHSWARFGATAAAPAAAAPDLEKFPPPIHPAELHPASLPREGEPPPPEGYLAALSKENEEPPRASYE